MLRPAFAILPLLVACSEIRSGVDPVAETRDAGSASPRDLDADAPIYTLSGGPCVSGASGVTAFRVAWSDGKTRAITNVEELGLPDPEGFAVNARKLDGSGPPFGDPFLGPGGLELDGSSYIDVELSTRGLDNVRTATLSLFGRSFDTTESGSFTWQTDLGSAKLPPSSISNGVPYAWSSADIAPQLGAGRTSVRLRVRPGPPSMSLVVARIELCIETRD